MSPATATTNDFTWVAHQLSAGITLTTKSINVSSVVLRINLVFMRLTQRKGVTEVYSVKWITAQVHLKGWEVSREVS